MEHERLAQRRTELKGGRGYWRKQQRKGVVLFSWEWDKVRSIQQRYCRKETKGGKGVAFLLCDDVSRFAFYEDERRINGGKRTGAAAAVQAVLRRSAIMPVRDPCELGSTYPLLKRMMVTSRQQVFGGSNKSTVSPSAAAAAALQGKMHA